MKQTLTRISMMPSPWALTAFALNIGDATQAFVGETLGYLFGYAAYRDFKLYVSMDVYASGAACYAGSTSCNGLRLPSISS